MKSGPSLASAMLLALLISSAPAAWAQNDPPPDLNMLLNLDLFKPNPNAAAQNGAGGNGSMLEQIQTLNALGYLGPNGSPPPNSYAPPPPPQNFEPPPASGDGETE
jgi:hypothetical protein